MLLLLLLLLYKIDLLCNIFKYADAFQDGRIACSERKSLVYVCNRILSPEFNDIIQLR